MSTNGFIYDRDHSRLRHVMVAVVCAIAVLAALVSPAPTASAQQTEDFDGLLVVRPTAKGQRGLNFGGSAVGLTSSRRVGFDERSSFDFGLSATGDFNGDGFDELAVANPDSDYLDIFVGTPYGISNLRDGFVASRIELVAAGDFDGDGYDDLAIVRSTTTGHAIKTYAGGPYYFESEESRTGSYVAGGAWEIEATATGDFNRDGYEDLLITRSLPNGKDRMLVFNGTGSGLAAARVVADTSYQIESVAASDFNGDGFDDVAIARSRFGSKDRVLMYKGTRTGLKWHSIVADTTFQVEAITASDFNGDGFGDLAVLRSTANGQRVLVHSGDSTHGLTGHTSIAFNTSWHIREIVAFGSEAPDAPVNAVLRDLVEQWKVRNPGFVPNCKIEDGILTCRSGAYIAKVMF